MNNLSSYCGLVDAKIRASDKDLPVTNKLEQLEFELEKLENIFFFSISDNFVKHTKKSITNTTSSLTLWKPTKSN